MGNVTCGRGEKGVGKGGRGAGVDILAVGQNFGNVEGNFARGAAGPFTLNDCVHRKRFFCFTRMG